MASPAVVYFLLVASLLFFLYTAPRLESSQQKSRRLYHHIVTHDPLVDEMERQAQEQGLLDVHAFWKKRRNNSEEMKYYFRMDGDLNITERLNHLFPMIDQSPSDGFISYAELDLWNKGSALDRLMFVTNQRMKIFDHDVNGEVPLSKLLGHIPENMLDWSDKRHGKPGWWKDLFQAADADENGSLNELEFNDLLHPEDSINPKVQSWFPREKLRQMDVNGDGKLSFVEFHHQAHGIYFDSPEYGVASYGDSKEENAEEKFAELDVNGDHYLSADELKPIIHRIQPGEFSHAMHYTKYLMHEADEDRDGRLTLKEVLDHPKEFYDAVYEEEPKSYFDDLNRHNDDLDDGDENDHDEL